MTRARLWLTGWAVAIGLIMLAPGHSSAQDPAAPGASEVGGLEQAEHLLEFGDMPFRTLQEYAYRGAQENQFYLVPKSVKLAWDRQRERPTISVLSTDKEDEIRVTLELQTDIDRDEAAEAIRRVRRSHPDATFAHMPYESLELSGFATGIDWELGDGAIASSRQLSDPIQITATMPRNSWYSLKSILEEPEGTGGHLVLKTATGKLVLNVKVSVLEYAGGTVSDLSEMDIVWDGKDRIAIRRLRNYGAFPIQVTHVGLQLGLRQGKTHHAEALPVIDPVWIQPGEQADLEISLALPSRVRSRLRVAGRNLPEGAENLDGVVTRYSLAPGPDTRCKECLSEVWNRIEGVSYLERLHRLRLMVPASAFEKDYGAGRRLEMVVLTLRSDQFSERADGKVHQRRAHFDVDRTESEDIAIFDPAGDETFRFEYIIEAAFTDGTLVESEWLERADRTNLTVSGGRLAKLLASAEAGTP
ncbi:MAG: hypothetical protein JRH01_04660 [Deltaproteobacteria bacterium]|nr:hypothetical protein [Deltaproteobacteria bacterium]